MTANRAESLVVGRPPGTSPGWTVWHVPSGLQAIEAVRYKTDAEQARNDLLLTAIDWTRQLPVRDTSPYWATYTRIYQRYRELRRRQLAESNYDWHRPKERTSNPAPGSLALGQALVAYNRSRKQAAS